MLKNAAALVASVVFSMAVAETALRVAFQEEPESSDPPLGIQLSEYMMHDQFLGWKLRPESDTLLETSEFQTHISINSEGFRGPEPSNSSADNESRILILGDSFAEGYTVALGRRFSELFENEVNKIAQSRFKVINLGVGGYSNDQQLIQFQIEGVKHDPNFVILLFHDNDVFFNVQSRYWRGHKPVFKIDGADLVLSNIPVPKPERMGGPDSVPESQNMALTRMQSIKSWLVRHSQIYQLTSQAVKNNYYLNSIFAYLGFSKSLEVPTEFRVYASSYDAEWKYAWDVTERVIHSLADNVERTGAELLIAYAPSRVAVYQDEWRATRWKYGMSRDQWNVYRVANDLADICERVGIPYLDLTPALQKAAVKQAGEGIRVYFEKDGHWTPEGNAQVAHELTRFFREHFTR